MRRQQTQIAREYFITEATLAPSRPPAQRTRQDLRGPPGTSGDVSWHSHLAPCQPGQGLGVSPPGVAEVEGTVGRLVLVSRSKPLRRVGRKAPSAGEVAL